MTAEQILEKAAQLVERPRGWCQCVLATKEGAVCLLGALWMADGRVSADGRFLFEPLGSDAGRDALHAVSMEAGSLEAAVSYNNVLDRTAAEVATLLRTAKRHLLVTA